MSVQSWFDLVRFESSDDVVVRFDSSDETFLVIFGVASWHFEHVLDLMLLLFFHSLRFIIFGLSKSCVCGERVFAFVVVRL